MNRGFETCQADERSARERAAQLEMARAELEARLASRDDESLFAASRVVGIFGFYTFGV